MMDAICSFKAMPSDLQNKMRTLSNDETYLKFAKLATKDVLINTDDYLSVFGYSRDERSQRAQLTRGLKAAGVEIKSTNLTKLYDLTEWDGKPLVPGLVAR